MKYEHESVSMLDETAGPQARYSDSAAAAASTEIAHADYRASLIERHRTLVVVAAIFLCVGYVLGLLTAP